MRGRAATIGYDRQLVRITPRHAGTRATLITLTAVLAVAVLAGCGLGAGPGTSGVRLTVTRDFGARAVGSVTERRVPGSQTVLRMLERSFRVETEDGQEIVNSIDGLPGGQAGLSWYLYVNGEAGIRAARTAVHPGDRIWWDLHDQSATRSIPAVVGSFPEPFTRGIGGRRLPTVLECASDVQAACNRASSALHAVGVPVAKQAPGTGSGTDSLAVIVGTWSNLRNSIAADVLDQGPSASGVYAKFAGPGGGTLELLGPQGRVVRALGPGAGLIAATAQGAAVPTWLVTGTDGPGVAAAAGALTAGRLDHHFALAVRGNANLPVPQDGGS